MAGGDGRDPDVVEVVGEERSEVALRLLFITWGVGGQSIHVIKTDGWTNLFSIWQTTPVGEVRVWPRERLRP